MAIKINITKDETPVQATMELNIRKTLAGHLMIMDHDDIDIVLLPEQNKIIAFIVGSISQNIHNDKVYGEVTYLFVHPEMMKWTVSAELFKELENWFVEENCEYLVALPSSWNSDYTINNNLLEEMKNFYDKQCNLVGYVFVKGL